MTKKTVNKNTLLANQKVIIHLNEKKTKKKKKTKPRKKVGETQIIEHVYHTNSYITSPPPLPHYLDRPLFLFQLRSKIKYQSI